MNKLIKIIAIASALTLLFSACREKETSSATIKADSMEIPGDAGDYTLSFSIDGYVSGVSVEAKADVDWITINNVQQGAEGKVEFSATQNDSSPREGRITLSYEGAQDKVVYVDQMTYGVDPDAAFKIDVQVLSAYSATVTYTPVSYNDGYLFLVMDAAGFERYLSYGTMDSLFASDLEWLLYQADHNGMTLEQFFERAGQVYALNGGVTEMLYSDLDRESEYYAYCYGLNGDGVPQTEVVYKKFKTEVVQTVDMTFTGRATDITKYSAKLEIEPSTDEYYYFYTYVSEMDMALYDLYAIMDNMVLNVKAYAEELGIPVTDYLCKGDDKSDASGLWAGTEYTVVAWGMDEAGNPTTVPQVAFTFDTPSEEIVDDCTFEITCPEVKDMDILVHVKPSNNETRYYIAVIDSSICVGYNDEQMAQRIINMEQARMESGSYPAYEGVTWENFPWLYTGEQEFWAQDDLDWTFKPETLYQIYVFGISNTGERTTAVARIDQRTAEAEESYMTFQAEVTEEDWHQATWHFTPSAEDEYWLPFLITTDDLLLYRTADGGIDEDLLVEDIIHYYDNSVLYYLQKGTRDVLFSHISDTDYTMLVCGWAGVNSTPFFEFPYKSPAIPFDQSDADLTATYELFDGADLYEMDPERWEGSQDVCVMYIKFNPNEHAVHWYGGVWPPVSSYSDVGGVHQLLILDMNPTVSFVDEYRGTIQPWFDNTWSFSYVAEGEDGTFGPWHYEEFTPQRGVNMEEPYDFWTNPDQNSMIMSIPKNFQQKADAMLLEQAKASLKNETPAVLPSEQTVENPYARTIPSYITADKPVKESMHDWKKGIEDRVVLKRTGGRHGNGIAETR